MRIDFLKFSHDTVYATTESPGTAGYDLYSVENAVFPPWSVRAISTNTVLRFCEGILVRSMPGLVLQ